MKTIIAAGLLLTATMHYDAVSAQPYRRARGPYVAYHHAPRYYNHYRPAYVYRPYRPYAARVSVIASLPFGALSLNFGGRPYHYYNGIFYRPDPYGYFMAPPPIGIIVPVIPSGSVAVMLDGRRCYYYSGTYYMPLPDHTYQVVKASEESDAEHGELVKDTADSTYEKVMIDGKTYYKKGSKYYKASVNDEGEIVYEAVGESQK